MLITGVDEVGYGALAGPIVAAAVTMEIPYPRHKLTRFWPMSSVKDSKKTTKPQRIRLASSLTTFLVHKEAGVGIGVVPASRIDVLGYSEAADEARRLAVERATAVDGLRPDLVIVDGTIPISRLRIPQQCIPQADAQYWLVAAASILAKIYRDTKMVRAATRHPEYGWEQNMGYAGGSIQDSPHICALVDHGLTSMHRRQPCQKVLRKRAAR